MVDIDYIPIQPRLEITKDIFGLKPNTYYKFRVVLYRVWNHTQFDALSFSQDTYARTICYGKMLITFGIFIEINYVL